VGLYYLALARLGHLPSGATDSVFARLALSNAELSFGISGTPFGRDVLERLNLIEAIAIGPSRSDPGALAKAQVEFDKLYTIYKPTARSTELSYFALLAFFLFPDERHKEFLPIFNNLSSNLREEPEPLWYGNNLFLDSLCLLNVLRCRNWLPADFVADLWRRSYGRLVDIALSALESRPIDILALLERPDTLVVLGPFLRVIRFRPLAPNEEDSIGTLLSAGAKPALARAYAAYEDDLRTASRKDGNLVRAVTEAFRETLRLDARIEPLKGGLSGSSVYIGSVRITEPVALPGPTLVFKTDPERLQGNEKRLYAALEKRGLANMFARVESDSQLAEIGGKKHSIVLYEFLSSYSTLREHLRRPLPEARHLRLLNDVATRLATLYRSETALVPMTSRAFWNEVLDRIKSNAARVGAYHVRSLQADVDELRNRTFSVLNKIPNVGLPKRMHITHGDLNCRNVMLSTDDEGNLADLKLIDYETLVMDGDPLLDIGELLEDSLTSAGYMAEPIVTDALLGPFKTIVGELFADPSAKTRLLLSRLRSITLILRHVEALGDGASFTLAQRILRRWRAVIDEIATPSV